MQPRQVFKEYARIASGDHRHVSYCPACGSKLTSKLFDGKRRKTCDPCGFIHFKNPAPAVSIIVVRKDEFVLCRRRERTFKGGKWCLPCGFVEYNEDYLTAAVREVKEETGLDVEIRSILSVVSNFFTRANHSLVAVLLAQPIGGQLRPQEHDIEHAQWFSYSGGLPELAFEADRHIIERYFATRLAGAPVDPAYARLPLPKQT